MNQISPPCPYCAGPTKTLVVAPDINLKIDDKLYHLCRCESCDLGFIADPPDDLGRYYPKNYHGMPKSVEELRPHLDHERFKIDLLCRYCQHGSLLEIGPSMGYFSQLAKEAGFQVSAIEYDAECCKYLTDVLGIRALNSTNPASAIEQDGRQYDAICLWHSVEHLPSPWKTLEAAAQHLAPNGILLVAAPNPDSWQARILGRRWVHYDLPRHLYQIPLPWLSTFGQQHGLKIVLATTRDKGSLFWNRFTWAMLGKSLTNSRIVGAILWRLGMAAGWLLQPWEGREGNGSGYVVVMKRIT